MIDIQELLKRYTNYESNLNHNLRFDQNKKTEIENNQFMNEEIKQKAIKSINLTLENTKGQLMIVREIVNDLQDKRDEYFKQSLDYKLGESV